MNISVKNFQGDSIEASMGSIITMSTMAAAAFGNTISDILGIGSAYYVELSARKIGFQPPKLTPIQMDLPKSRLAANIVSLEDFQIFPNNGSLVVLTRPGFFLAQISGVARIVAWRHSNKRSPSIVNPLSVFYRP